MPHEKMIVEILIIFGLLILSALHWIIKTRNFDRRLQMFTGPKPIPFIGNVLDFPSTKHVLPAFLKYQHIYGGIVKLSVGPNIPSLNISDYNFLEFILSSPKIITKSKEYDFFERWLGRGLLTSTGEKWQKRRKLLTPAFHFQILEQFIEVFNGASDYLVEKLLAETKNDQTDIYPYVTLCALDVICESAMGIKIHAQEKEDSDYVTSVKEMGRIIIERAISPLKQFEFFYLMSRDYQKEKKALKILHSTTNSVIKKRREELQKKNSFDYEYDGFGKKKRLAFLDLLIQSTVDGQPLSDDDIREEVDTFMFEGHDTTSSGISFTLYSLATNPKVQEKVCDELHEIFEGDKERAATYKDLQDMKYLEMVIKESLRLYPPVPMYNRVLDSDVEYNGKILPKGLTTGIFAYGIQRHPDFFPNPDVFDPERFAIENKISRKPYCYIPFSAGPRNCIGQKFAMLELKATVSKILRNYELCAVPGFEPVLSAESILKSANGIYIKLCKRKFSSTYICI